MCTNSLAEIAEEIKVRHPLYATDAEWATLDDNPYWLSSAVEHPDGHVTVYMTAEMADEALRDQYHAAATAEGNVSVEFIHRDATTRLIPDGRSELLFFFSPKDPMYALGEDEFKAAVDKGVIYQRNAIGSSHTYPTKLRDLSGFSGKESLFAMATSLGIPMSD